MAVLSAAMMCLALNIYREAGNEPFHGKLAVALVTVNRSKKRHQSLCEVVYSKNQFSWTSSRHSAANTLSRAWKDSVLAAHISFKVRDFTKGATYFHEQRVSPKWATTVRFVGLWGRHKFYREG